MEPNYDLAAMALPQRTRTSLAFCQSSASEHLEALTSWQKELPKTDHSKTGQLLAEALQELAELDAPPSELLQLAESLRSQVLSVTHTLYQQHLKRHLTFNAIQQEQFELCERLYQNLVQAFKAVLQCCIDHNEQGELQTRACHRAFSDSSFTYLFYCQLYRPAPEGFWRNLHQLYQIAVNRQLHSFSQADPFDSKSKPLSAAGHYKRTLLMSKSRSSQLSRDEIRQTWQALSLWVPHCTLRPQSGLQTYFAANLNSDEGLHYATPDPDTAIPGVIGLDVRVLTNHLKKIKENPKTTSALSPELLGHLASTWTHICKRSSPRQAGGGSCSISLGFSGLHYHLCEKKPFNDIIAPFSSGKGGGTGKGAGKSEFSAKTGDVWSEAHDTLPSEEETLGPTTHNETITFNSQSLEGDSHFPILPTTVINHSSKGFCLRFNAIPPHPFHAGEPVGIQQESSATWALAVVRWVEVNNTEVTLGVELLSAKPVPAAISLIHKTQDMSHFHRAFLIQTSSSDPSHERSSDTLIMPRLPSKPGLKFQLVHNHALSNGQLMECISTTASFNEYQYRLFD